jgi:hypothetical protein
MLRLAVEPVVFLLHWLRPYIYIGHKI